MTDYISKQAAIEAIMGQPPDAHYPSWYAEQIKEIQPADVRPVVRGLWLPHPDKLRRAWDVCSVCGTGCKRREYGVNEDLTKWETEYNYHFCPWCGAQLGGDAE